MYLQYKSCFLKLAGLHFVCRDICLKDKPIQTMLVWMSASIFTNALLFHLLSLLQKHLSHVLFCTYFYVLVLHFCRFVNKVGISLRQSFTWSTKVFNSFNNEAVLQSDLNRRICAPSVTTWWHFSRSSCPNWTWPASAWTPPTWTTSCSRS